MRVIIGATNEQLGVMKLPDALRKAQSLGLNLVEVAPNAVPPVCRIVDFGKYRYELSKQDKEKKNAAGKLKEIKFRVNIDDHDYLTKVRRAEEFLDKGYKLKIHLQFRGREMAHQELGMALMQRVKADLNYHGPRGDGAKTRRQEHRHDPIPAANGQSANGASCRWRKHEMVERRCG